MKHLIFLSTCPFLYFFYIHFIHHVQRCTRWWVCVGKVNCSAEIKSDCFQRILLCVCVDVHMAVCMWGRDKSFRNPWQVWGCAGDCLQLLRGIDQTLEGKRWLMWKANRSREETKSKLHRERGKLIRWENVLKYIPHQYTFKREKIQSKVKQSKNQDKF